MNKEENKYNKKARRKNVKKKRREEKGGYLILKDALTCSIAAISDFKPSIFS